MELIKAESLSVKEGRNYIVHDVNWQVNSGENWVLFGLNGCGKTTLLSILAGYTNETMGKVSLFGETLTAENVMPLRRRIGWVSSSFFDRYLHYESIQDIVLAGKHGALGFQGTLSNQDVRQAKALLTQFGLKSKMRYPYDTLSKGQQQRVLIARALMGKPEVLVLDEPCSGLDIYAREYFLHMLQDLAEEQGITVVYVTHHTEEILPFFDKAILMREGKIHSQGELQTVFSDANLTDFFGVTTETLWTQSHFFINLDWQQTHLSQKKFQIPPKQAKNDLKGVSTL